MLSLDRLIDHALREDIHTGDITTKAVLSEQLPASARFIAKEDLVLAGLFVVERVFKRLSTEITFASSLADGARVSNGDIIANAHGNAADLLMGERVALNLLQRLSGIASITALYVEAVKGTKARIVDTRKTTPGLRELEKYAVRIGGGFNHRTGLYDGVLIKENHIAAAGGITAAVSRARDYIPHTLKIEVETETLDQVDEALAAGADVIMLDNMTLEEMTAAVAKVAGRVLVEASGGVTLERVRAIAETGVDIISVGALTHSPRSMDISMRFV